MSVEDYARAQRQGLGRIWDGRHYVKIGDRWVQVNLILNVSRPYRDDHGIRRKGACAPAT